MSDPSPQQYHLSYPTPQYDNAFETSSGDENGSVSAADFDAFLCALDEFNSLSFADGVLPAPPTETSTPYEFDFQPLFEDSSSFYSPKTTLSWFCDTGST